MSEKKVGIVDFGVGNLRSIERAITVAGARPVRSRNAAELCRCDRMVLPGVGAFPHGMAALRDRDLVSVVKDSAFGARPVLAICLGMQLLFEGSEEFGGAEGLGVLRGHVSRLGSIGASRNGNGVMRLPNVGWSPVLQRGIDQADASPIFRGVADGEHFYFAHSYAVTATQESVVGVASYEDVQFGAVVNAGSIVGFQGHPEKSGEAGLRIFRNFIRWKLLSEH